MKHAGRFILFSAAVPGQGGEHHVNEQPYDYWRKRFAEAGFTAYDFVRPRIAADNGISFWYRYNIILFVRDELAGESEPCREGDQDTGRRANSGYFIGLVQAAQAHRQIALGKKPRSAGKVEGARRADGQVLMVRS